MNDERAAEIRAALDVITQGKWVALGRSHVVVNPPDNEVVAVTSPVPDEQVSNTAFIANAPDWLRELLAERDRLRKVAEIAKTLDYRGWWSGCVMVNQDTWKQLQQALAELDAVGEGK